MIKMRSLLEKKWFIYTAGLAFFFVLFRYYGYFEDAGRYLLQAVHFLHPERFVNDVPFMFGNQDNFTVFSPLLVCFFKVFGVNHGGIVAVLLIELLWGLAAITLFVRWTKMWSHPTWALPAFVACLVVLTNKQYGSGAYFPIIDHILVARFAAEVFILLGLAFLWSRNRYISLAMFLLASVLHPLMGGWGIPLWLLLHYPVLRLPMAIVVVLAPLTGFLHVGRLDFFPNDWFGERLPFTPTGEDAIFYAGVLVFWWVVWKFCKNLAVSRFASAIFWLSLFGIFWLYAGIFMRHELLVQAQPYRVLWLGFVPMVPVSVLCLWDFFRKPTAISLWLKAKPKLVFTVFVFVLAFLVTSVLLHNMVQLAMEQDVGNVGLARNLMDLPAMLAPAHKVVLGVLALICLAESLFGLAIAFGLSLFNGDLTILPIIAIILYLFPSIEGVIKDFLIVAAVVISLAEYLSGLQASPLLGPGVQSSLFLVALLILVGLTTYLYRCHRENVLWIPFLLMIVTLVAWDVAKWDVRNESRVLDEQQMDAFFDQTAFPQIKDRGKILFVEKGESPLQSRFKFLTGTYADETINIGELFYKGQFLEARARKNALLLGDTVLGFWGNYSQRIAEVYANPDTLLTRVNFLCSINDITHFVTDYVNISLPKKDSLFLVKKNKYVYLYGCK
ncbi:MAG: hypothetical protein IJM92_00645 [Fibrobacter sp.]|uniref:hypothetical protein n=1 Tax=Fibrobacter sp. TaxID=35828 RepID=UPI0025BAC986|nr:hypothetical protein [Fibrobacter sp.]MBQ3715750.1 hypothetical protein [Fibrobacter sp.]MBQ7078182.1 hypothetical protein [Fibrobacter sp.]